MIILFFDYYSLSRLSASGYEPLVGGYFLEGHRSAGAELLGADADLRSQAELRAIGETCRRVDIDARCIHHSLKLLLRFLVVGDDALAVSAAVGRYVVESLILRSHGLYGKLHAHPLREPDALQAWVFSHHPPLAVSGLI